MALVAYQGLFDQLLLLDFPDFGQTVGRALKDYKAFDGTEITWPKNGDANPMQLTWLLDALRDTPIDMAGIVIPAALPVGIPNQMNWWRVHGKVMIHRWRMVITVDKDLYHDFVNEEKALSMLDRDGLIAGAGRAVYLNWQAAIDANDLTGARAIHEGAGLYNRMIGRAMHRFGPGAPTPRADDLQNISFQKYLGRCHKLEEAELERTYAASFPQEEKRQGLGEQLRIALTNFEHMGAGLEQAIAVIASTPDADVTVATLASVPSLLFDKALMLLVDMMSIMFGTNMGVSPASAVKAIVEKWTALDQDFALVTSKYSHGQASNSAYGYYKQVIQKRMIEWVGHLWSYLKGSLLPADGVQFAFFFSEDELVRKATYVTLNNYVQQLQDAGTQVPAPSGAAAAGAGGTGTPVPTTGVGGVVGRQEQCPVCVAAGKQHPATNHSLEYCSTAKRKMGLNRNGQPLKWQSDGNKGKGGGKNKGKGGGKNKGGGKGKPKGSQTQANPNMVCWTCGGNHHRDFCDGSGFHQFQFGGQPWQPPFGPPGQQGPPRQPQFMLQGPPGKGKGQPGPPISPNGQLMLANQPHW